MTLDLTAAIEAAARVEWESSRPEAEPTDLWWIEPWEDLSERQRQVGRNCARPVVEAAAPLIEAAVRDDIAEDIERYVEAQRPDLADDQALAVLAGMEQAAAIIRGEV